MGMSGLRPQTHNGKNRTGIWCWNVYNPCTIRAPGVSRRDDSPIDIWIFRPIRDLYKVYKESSTVCFEMAQGMDLLGASLLGSHLGLGPLGFEPSMFACVF